MSVGFPVSRIPDPSQASPLRWGILGPGGIARSFVDALAKHTRQRVVAVGSRSAERAGAFAAAHDIRRAHGSYEALVDDPDVDVVYVASPTGQHHEHALLAIAAGKHVLVEKSFSRTAAEAAEMVAAARTADVVLLEAMWTRFLPHIDVVRQLVGDGVLGEIQTVIADHGQLLTPGAAPRLHSPELGGGALLDLGVYPLSFAALILGTPDSILAAGEMATTGVDSTISAVLRTGGAHAVVTTTLTARTPTTASISGTAGRLEIAADFYTPAELVLTTQSGSVVREVDGIRGHEALCFQAAHLAHLVEEGRRDSPLLPLVETVGIMATMDEIRRQVAVG